MDDELRWIREIQKRNSRHAAEKLVDAHYNEIYVYAYRQTGSKPDAMDLSQDIFIAVLRALPSYNPKLASFRTWMYRIAARKAIDRRRRTCPPGLSLDQVSLPSDEDFTEVLASRDLLERIEEFVSGQDPRAGRVFHLRLYSELTFPEIADVCGESEPAVKSRFHRLLQQIRKEFGENGKG